MLEGKFVAVILYTHYPTVVSTGRMCQVWTEWSAACGWTLERLGGVVQVFPDVWRRSDRPREGMQQTSVSIHFTAQVFIVPDIISL